MMQYKIPLKIAFYQIQSISNQKGRKEEKEQNGRIENSNMKRKTKILWNPDKNTEIFSYFICPFLDVGEDCRINKRKYFCYIL